VSADRDMTTHWFPISIRPLHVGWYEVRFWITHERKYAGPVRRWWNGRMWRLDERAPGMGITIRENDQWRGKER
jgi:hypothetical protein